MGVVFLLREAIGKWQLGISIILPCHSREGGNPELKSQKSKYPTKYLTQT
jgi:hypothetical protein